MGIKGNSRNVTVCWIDWVLDFKQIGTDSKMKQALLSKSIDDPTLNLTSNISNYSHNNTTSLNCLVVIKLNYYPRSPEKLLKYYYIKLTNIFNNEVFEWYGNVSSNNSKTQCIRVSHKGWSKYLNCRSLFLAGNGVICSTQKNRKLHHKRENHTDQIQNKWNRCFPNR